VGGISIAGAASALRVQTLHARLAVDQGLDVRPVEWAAERRARPLRIAILGENYYPTVGGIQEHIRHQALFLRARGHHVRVITGMPRTGVWSGPKDEEWVVRVGASTKYRTMGTSTTFTLGPAVADRLARTFREERFDVLHVHGPFDFGLPLLAYLTFRGPKVATAALGLRSHAGPDPGVAVVPLGPEAHRRRDRRVRPWPRPPCGATPTSIAPSSRTA